MATKLKVIHDVPRAAMYDEARKMLDYWSSKTFFGRQYDVRDEYAARKIIKESGVDQTFSLVDLYAIEHEQRGRRVS